MEGILEEKRNDGTVKIDGKWITLVGGAKRFAENIKVGARVKYLEDGRLIKYANGKAEGTEPKEEPKAKEEFKGTSDTHQKMADCLIKAETIYQSEVLGDEFKEKIDWTKIAISMFIAERNSR